MPTRYRPRDFVTSDRYGTGRNQKVSILRLRPPVPSDALWTRTQATQVLPGVNARRVPILPGDRHCVVSDGAHVDELGLLSGELLRRRQDARRCAFSPAHSTGATPPKKLERIGAVVSIQPGYVNCSLLERRGDDIGRTLVARQVRHAAKRLFLGADRKVGALRPAESPPLGRVDTGIAER